MNLFLSLRKDLLSNPSQRDRVQPLHVLSLRQRRYFELGDYLLLAVPYGTCADVSEGASSAGGFV